jgi:hypothetical protein
LKIAFGPFAFFNFILQGDEVLFPDSANKKTLLATLQPPMHLDDCSISRFDDGEGMALVDTL